MEQHKQLMDDLYLSPDEDELYENRKEEIKKLTKIVMKTAQKRKIQETTRNTRNTRNTVNIMNTRNTRHTMNSREYK